MKLIEKCSFVILLASQKIKFVKSFFFYYLPLQSDWCFDIFKKKSFKKK